MLSWDEEVTPVASPAYVPQAVLEPVLAAVGRASSQQMSDISLGPEVIRQADERAQVVV